MYEMLITVRELENSVLCILEIQTHCTTINFDYGKSATKLEVNYTVKRIAHGNGKSIYIPLI